MPEVSASTRPRLTPGDYWLVKTTDGNWLVLFQGKESVFPDRIFKQANDAALALAVMAAEHRIPYTRLYDSQTGVVSAVIVGKPPQTVVLSLVLPFVVDADLDNMAEELETTKGGAVLKAIALLKIAMDAKHEGKRVVIVDDRDDSEQDITGF